MTTVDLKTPVSGLFEVAKGRSVRLAQRALTLPERKLKWVTVVWALLFFDILGSSPTPLLPLPHKVGQMLTQGALWAGLLLALAINRKIKLRPSLFLGIYSLIAIAALMSSVRFVSLGTVYRAVRLMGFIATLWVLTPWWGRRDMVILRSHLKLLVAILGSVLLGMVLSPGGAFAAGGRLQGAIWPIPPTQVADYSAELAGLCIILWMSRLISKWPAILVGLASLMVELLTHTRTALGASVLGCLVGGVSLFTTSRRVRRVFAAGVLTMALVGVPMSPLIVHWLTRGQSTTQLESLTGRTNFWGYVFEASAHRPLTNELLGNGLSNGSINDPLNPSVSGLPIDSSWVEDYQDQGLVGDALTALIFITLLVTALMRPRGPARAIALFLTVYCLIASFTEDGAGIASQYALDMTVAASMLALPIGAGARLRRKALGAAAPSDTTGPLTATT